MPPNLSSSYTDHESPSMLASGSRLLSLESPLSPSESSSSRTGPGGEDLSLSELSLSDYNTIMKQPFSLLAKPVPDLSTPKRDTNIPSPHLTPEKSQCEEELLDDADSGRALQLSKNREDKLQSDIFILKKLNASFELFNEALRETGSAHDRVAIQLEQTDALLNKYIGILSTSEEFSRLIFDEQWKGAEADEELLQQERREEMERKRRAAEEQALRAQQDLLRIEKEKREALQREEKERLEREKSERAIRGGVRGVRGMRASSRGNRGAAPSRTDTNAGVSRGVPKRTPSTRPSTSTIGRGSSSRPT